MTFLWDLTFLVLKILSISYQHIDGAFQFDCLCPLSIMNFPLLSRIHVQAYVQQLESSRLKLTQLEQELQRARQQVIYSIK